MELPLYHTAIKGDTPLRTMEPSKERGNNLTLIGQIPNRSNEQYLYNGVYDPEYELILSSSQFYLSGTVFETIRCSPYTSYFRFSPRSPWLRLLRTRATSRYVNDDPPVEDALPVYDLGQLRQLLSLRLRHLSLLPLPPRPPPLLLRLPTLLLVLPSNRQLQ
jgi:hypothetical protein